jgi:hypothetical protein
MIVMGGEIVGQGVEYELDYCVSNPFDEYEGENTQGGPLDPPDCTGNLDLDHTLSMSYGMGGTSIEFPAKGRWGNTFRIEGTASGMSLGTYEMKAYFAGAGVNDGIRMIDWHDQNHVELVHMTTSLSVGNTTSDNLEWRVETRFTCVGGATINQKHEGTVEMVRFGDYYRLNGPWSQPVAVGYPEPMARYEDCLSREFTYGDETEYEHQLQFGYSWEGISAQLGLVLKKKFSSGLKITGPANKKYTFAKITRKATAPIKKNSFDYRGLETNVVTFDLDKLIYSYEVTDVGACP